MEEKLTAIYNAFIPDIPAIPNYYENCREARGGEFLVKEIVRRLKKTKNERLRFLFTGHRGCGKSSELKYLKRIIENETTVFPIYIDFEQYLDRQDVTLEDIFLGIISEVADKCNTKFGIKAKQESYSLLKNISEFVSGIAVKAEVGLPVDLAKVNVEKLKKNPILRKQIRDAIKGNEKRTLLSELNDFILDIEVQLKNKTAFNQIIIIADTLEYINTFEGIEDILEAQKQLFIDKQEELNIGAHVLYTVPLSLYRSKYGKLLTEDYGNEVFVLPMVKIHNRTNFEQNFELGWDALKKVINKRLNPCGMSIEDTFEADAIEHLIKYSGGNIRSLIRFIQDVSISVDVLPIDFQAARNSVKKAVRGFAASVKENHWKKLAELELSQNQQIENGDTGYADLLNATAIHEYRNGDDSEMYDDVWYAVNPAIRRTLKFQEELEELKTVK